MCGVVLAQWFHSSEWICAMNVHTAGLRRGVVAAPHHAAVAAGREILAEGGNALEAMLAMAGVIAAVYPHMNHIGGDGFWLVREPSGRVRAIMAAGRAGAKATPAFYREAGHYEVPQRGPLAALTVPGAIAGWIAAARAAEALGGRLPLDVLLGSAIGHARDGFKVVDAIAEAAAGADLKSVPGFADTFFIDGKPPEEGAALRQPKLAETLAYLVNAGLPDFYKGDVGREMAADLERIGSPVTRADIERCEATIAEPLSVKLACGTLYNTGAPTQGLASLMILALFERLKVREADGFDHIHGLVEATKRAFRIRDRFITDPAQMERPASSFLDAAVLDREAAKIDMRKAAPWPGGVGDADTVWMGAADASGLVVSYIQSIYWEFGSGVVLPRTGVLMQNRGCAFSLETGAARLLAPGRLPFHTLNPALAVLNDGRVMAYGTRGGDGQPQTQAAVFSRHVLFRQPLDVAIEAPRWVLGRTWGESRDDLRFEARFDGTLLDRLQSAGHPVEVFAEDYSHTVGHAGAAIFHPDRTLEGAHDPRSDGGADGV